MGKLQQQNRRKLSTASSAYEIETPKKMVAQKMLSDRFYHILARYLGFYNYLSSTPILVDKETKCLYVSKSARFRFSYIVVPSLVIYTTVWIIQSVQLYLSRRGKNFYFTCVYSFCGVSCICTVSLLILYPEELTSSINSILTLFVHVQSKLIMMKNA